MLCVHRENSLSENLSGFTPVVYGVLSVRVLHVFAGYHSKS